jgi:integrase
MTTQDMFEAPTVHGLRTFVQAFEAWLGTRQSAGVIREPSSVAVYRSMWSALSDWCVGKGIGLDDLSACELETFLMARARPTDLSDRYAWRMLTLVDEVLTRFAQTTGHGQPHAARDLLRQTPRWRYANAVERTPLPDHLDGAEAGRLVAWLLSPSGDAVAGVGPASSWQSLRARASVALQMGAGLSPAEIRAVRLDGVAVSHGRVANAPWKIRVPALGPDAARDTPIAPWAGRLLRLWLDTRTALVFDGPLLFPAARDGRPWSRVAQYNAAKAVLGAAGVNSVDGGSYRLRHTFALRQLRRGTSPDEVARWLGMANAGALWRYRRVLDEPAEMI